MDFITRVAAPQSAAVDCVAVGIYADGSLTPAAKKIDQASKGAVAAAVKSGDATGKRGQAVLLRALPGVKAARVLLVGLGKEEDVTDKAYAEAVRTSVKHAGAGTKQLALAAGDWKVKERDAAWQARTLAVAARETVFRVDELKSKKDNAAPKIEQVAWLAEARDAAAERGLREGTAVANGMDLTKRLGNLPPNICTPRYLADQAKKMAREFDLDVDVLDRKDIEKLGMGAFLSV
ncbi:MAG: M17 family peptidase N-terminal domain-containing protein, partial [Betaproteobacteria bacterium]